MHSFLSTVLALAFAVVGCTKADDVPSCDLPSSKTPSGLVSGWVNGYTNRTQLVNVYTGENVGTTWASGKYFRFTANGKAAEFYYMAKGQYFTSGTYAKGNVKFDEGSTDTEGSFTFYACSAHFKGAGSQVVDRAATPEECKNQLTRKYYYRVEGEWLRINPGSPVDAYSSSFRKTD